MPTGATDTERPGPLPALEVRRFSLKEAPLWLLFILAALAWMAIRVFTDVEAVDAYRFVIGGLTVTLRITLFSFVISVILGLLAGLGRISRNFVLRNIAIAYVEFIRGVPIVVLILMIAFSIAPAVAGLFGLASSSIPPEARFIFALSIIYGAFIAEVFRAGVESIPKGQMEAGRSLGLSHTQTMRTIILPQAVRVVLPALGNDFIALLKDSALATLLGVRDLTQAGRLYTGRTFRFDETFLVLTMLYLTGTLTLSLGVQRLQRRLGRG